MNLATYLSERKISDARFAELIGVSQVAVTRYATGKRVPRPEHMKRIREVTAGQVTPDDFFREGAAPRAPRRSRAAEADAA